MLPDCAYSLETDDRNATTASAPPEKPAAERWTRRWLFPLCASSFSSSPPGSSGTWRAIGTAGRARRASNRPTTPLSSGDVTPLSARVSGYITEMPSTTTRACTTANSSRSSTPPTTRRSSNSHGPISPQRRRRSPISTISATCSRRSSARRRRRSRRRTPTCCATSSRTSASAI